MNVVYKEITISDKSDAIELFKTKQFGKLDEHLNQLEIKRRRLEGEYPWRIHAKIENTGILV